MNESKPVVSFQETDEEAKRIASKQKEEIAKSSPLVIFDDDKDPGKTKTFLVLLVGTDGDDEYSYWELCVGRQAAYDLIKSFIESVDLINSYIVAEDDSIKNKKRVIDFLRYVLDSGKIEDPGFDPMDYVVGDYEYEDDKEE